MPPCRSRWSGEMLSRIATSGLQAARSGRAGRTTARAHRPRRRACRRGPARRCRCCRRCGRRARPGCSIWPIRAVVVDLPLVPVMATTFGRLCVGRGVDGAGEQLDVADDLDAGGLGLVDRPVRLRDGSAARRATASGRRTPTSRRRSGPRPRSPRPRPARGRRRSSSHSTGSAPPAIRARAAVSPVRPRPNTATRLPFEAADRDHARALPTAASGWRGRPGPA